MKVCTNCKKELPDDAVFCDNCGTRVEEVNEIVAKKEKSNHGLFRKGILILGVIVVVAGVVLGVVHFAGRNTDVKGNAICFVSDNELMLLDQRMKETITLSKNYIQSLYANNEDDEDENNEDDTDAVGVYEDENNENEAYKRNKIIKESINSITTYRDEKRVVYPDKLICVPQNTNVESYSLYYRMLKGDNTDPVKIDSEVTGEYQVVDNGNKIVYQAGTDLYMYDFKEKKKLAKDVMEESMWQAAEDGSNINYISSDGKLYQVDADGTEKKIASGLTRDDGLGKAESLYKADPDQLYYTTTVEEEINIADYIEDDLEPLAEVTEPECPDEPEEVYWDDYEDDADYEKAYKKWEKEYKKWEEEKEAYDEAYVTYEVAEEKQEKRQTFWDTVKEMKVTVDIVTLYYYDGEQVQELGSYATEGEQPDMLGDAAFFSAVLDQSRIDKLKASDYFGDDVDVDEEDDDVYTTLESDVVELFERGEVEKACWIVDGKCYDLGLYMNEVSAFYATVKMNGFIYLQDEELKQIELAEGKLQEPVVYDTGVTGIAYVTEVDSDETKNLCYWKEDALYINKKKVEGITDAEDIELEWIDDGVLYYYQDIDKNNEDNETGTLCVYKDGKTKQIASDVKLYSLQKEADGRFYYMKDYDSDGQEGVLCYLEDNEPVVAVEDVHEYCVTENGSIYYLKNYDEVNYTADLYLHEKKEEKLIQSDVQGAALPQWK